MIIQLKNVRLSFPALWVAEAFEGEGEKKYKATFLIPKTDPQVKIIKDAINEVSKAKWGAKAPAIVKAMEGNSNKICFYDGESKSYDGYAGCMALSASNKKRPTVKDRNAATLTESDERPYAGCYVNGSVELWAQDNKWGKGMRASLRGVQFYRDGDQFTAGSVAGEDEFEDLGEGSDAGDEDLS